MAVLKGIDRRPGAMPEIRADGESVVFQLAVSNAGTTEWLVLRCDEKGEVWASIESAGSLARPFGAYLQSPR